MQTSIRNVLPVVTLCVVLLAVGCARAPKQTEEMTERELYQPSLAEDETSERPRRPDVKEQISFEDIDSNLCQRIHFDFDKSSIKSKYEAGLKRNAEWIKDNPKYQVLIEGHCDERGSNEYNIGLGERRAESTKQYLVKLGVAPNRLITKSWGEEKPLDLGKTEEAYALNRRAEFYAIVTGE